jgi:hypothetical protein
VVLGVVDYQVRELVLEEPSRVMAVVMVVLVVPDPMRVDIRAVVEVVLADIAAMVVLVRQLGSTHPEKILDQRVQMELVVEVAVVDIQREQTHLK